MDYGYYVNEKIPIILCFIINNAFRMTMIALCS